VKPVLQVLPDLKASPVHRALPARKGPRGDRGRKAKLDHKDHLDLWSFLTMLIWNASTCGESWKSSEITTMTIAFTSRSATELRENDPGQPHPPTLLLTTTHGGTIAAVCSRCRQQRNL